MNAFLSAAAASKPIKKMSMSPLFDGPSNIFFLFASLCKQVNTVPPSPPISTITITTTRKEEKKKRKNEEKKKKKNTSNNNIGPIEIRELSTSVFSEISTE